MRYDARHLVGMVALGVLEDLRQETASRAERDPSLRPLVDLTLPSVHHPPCAYRSDMSYDATRRRLDGLTDHVGFERLVMILLTRTGINARPLGGPGDRNRDAVAGLYRAAGGEPLAVTISLARRCERKIRTDLKRIHDHGFRPETVISVTNRPAPAPAQAALQAQVKKQYGVDLTIHEQRWLVTQFHRRDNLDLLGEYLNLLPPQPRFFLDLSAFEKLLEERGLLTAPFAGRREELDEVERLLTDQGRAVIIEAPGGFGKTRLAVELARSGRSIPWFFGGSTTECGYSSGPWHSKMLVGPHRRGAETGMGDAHRPDRKVVGAQAPTRRSLARARHYCIQPPSGPSWYHRARGLVRAGADHRHGCVAPPPARLR